jgi:hypothetical protein
VLDLSHVPMFMIEHAVIPFNLDGPKDNAPEEVPNLKLFTISPRKPFSEHCMLPIVVIIITTSNTAKFMHDKGGPSSCSPSLNAVPNFMFNRLTHVNHTIVLRV